MLRPVLATLALLAAVATAGQAQFSDSRRGLWLGLGAGQAWAKSTCSICAATSANGLAGYARVGGTLSRMVLAGIEGTGWFERGGPLERSFLTFAAVATLYPFPDYGLHLKAGLGGYWYAEEDSAVELSTQGLAGHLGAGFDVRITPGVSLTPFVALVNSGFGNPTRLDKPTGIKLPLLSDMTLKFYQLGLAVTVH